MSILDWISKKVQNFSGETERRQFVNDIKCEFEKFRTELVCEIPVINEAVNKFNERIMSINKIRMEHISKQIIRLSDFLGKFGHIKSIGYYNPEHQTAIIEIPKRQFENTENYIAKLDWSKEQIYEKSVKDGAFKTREETRKQNLSMREWLDKFKVETAHTLEQLKTLKITIKQNQQIADLYIFCITFISKYIEEIIIPELDVVEAFFQVVKIKNELVVRNNLQEFGLTDSIFAVETLNNTPYKKHYLFVKNVFMFYIISCKIYNTPILTQLLSEDIKETDANYEIMKNHRDALLQQKDAIISNLSFPRSQA